MNEWIAREAEVVAQTYGRCPVVFVKGEGTTLTDDAGKTYTDFLAGIAVCNLGHAHPKVAEALAEQAKTLCHVSNLFYTRPQVELAEWLTERCFADRVFLCNSGAEANEAAIKLARKYFHDKGESRHRILSMARSFHGRTMATLSATGQDKVKEGFTPLLPGFEYVAFNDMAALEEAMDETVCAVLVEPIQGEGGVCVPDDGYLEAVRALCDRSGALLIFDEIQTGMGRTGKLFAYQHTSVTPDIMTLAKALGNGLPIGAMLATDKVMASFSKGAHGSTFGGTPLVSAAALAVVRAFDEEKVVEKAADTGAYFKASLEGLKAKHSLAKDVRGQGLLLGLEINGDGAAVVEKALAKGQVINAVQGNTLRFVPPLIITRPEIDTLMGVLDEIFTDMGAA
ncbi:acetylornithine transaminase [Desulfoluna spongiiphila]|uniref:acetylornithine transaminase n=1 Tax=Desulfoluna spongiiphila TaxID=419481 RepID=UPI00125461E0|nr:acetylornithine transaminase [Desulfoluna spongiiphila]VVS90876.1 pyridoxal phosphate-dependent transferase [Desulfoluna spongiiphila]